MTPLSAELGAAYGASSAAWAGGPQRIYSALGGAMLARCPVPLTGGRVLDVGAGTGVVSQLLAARGALPVGVDVSIDMLRHGAPDRPPGTVGDAMHLPFATASVDGAVYAFCLNHLLDPVAALRETVRVVRPGGVVLGAVFALDNDHPAKALVEDVLLRWGWRRPDWYAQLKDRTEPLLATAARFAEAATAAGLTGVDAVETEVDTGVHDAGNVAAWRLGMAHTAPFVASLPPVDRASLVADAERAVATRPRPLCPRVVLLRSRVTR